MMLKLTLRRTGNSVGLVLPKEALDHLGASEGDAVHATQDWKQDCGKEPTQFFCRGRMQADALESRSGRRGWMRLANSE